MNWRVEKATYLFGIKRRWRCNIYVQDSPFFYPFSLSENRLFGRRWPKDGLERHSLC